MSEKKVYKRLLKAT